MGTLTDPFDIAVIGAGLIGASAARHLAEAGHRVVVLAAAEPTDWRAGAGPFASHYDAGRITRITANDPVWAELAARSIGRYGDIAARSEIDFHHPAGLVWLASSVEAAVKTAGAHGGDCRVVDHDWVGATTGISVPADLEAAYEGPPAGWVDPRRLVAAQLKLAKVGGSTLIAEPATAVSHNSAGPFTVTTPSTEVRAERLLVATGAYGARLVGVDLALDRMLRTTVRIDMGPRPGLTSLIQSPVDHPDLDDVYWVPPTPYPDGRKLFKIGGDLTDARMAETEAEINAWFSADGDPREAQALVEVTRARLIDVNLDDRDTVPCVVTRTTSGYPYVGWVDDDVAVVIGGNGSSAKSCDEIGRLASTLFADTGLSDDSLPADLFEPRLA